MVGVYGLRGGKGLGVVGSRVLGYRDGEVKEWKGSRGGGG